MVAKYWINSFTLDAESALFFFVYCLKELKAIHSIGSPSEASAAITFAPYRERETFLVLCHPSKMARPLKLLSIYG